MTHNQHSVLPSLHLFVLMNDDKPTNNLFLSAQRSYLPLLHILDVDVLLPRPLAFSARLAVLRWSA